MNLVKTLVASLIMIVATLWPVLIALWLVVAFAYSNPLNFWFWLLVTNSIALCVWYTPGIVARNRRNLGL